MIEVLNRFARLASARSEVVGASLIILMIVMMVIPLGPGVLDVLLAINISVSVVLVISAVLIETPLAFSSFPALLLMTTLFRLSLTISTTRQILLEGDAGHIVQTFGEFVVGGNVAVGLTIFLIISVVNFLVITKGSERVAEVAARFSLDGMPGKQMSIDSDLRAGLITQTVAKQRRSDLEKESQLFGAMDGAIKFVKNDAIAGLVITVVNLLGGLTVGMIQKGMTFSEAGSVYTILSVGDGLVAIIPSLMVSIAAGLIVTRVTKGEAGLFEQICHQHTHERKLKVLMLGVEFEQLIRESSRSDGNGSFIDIDSSSLNELIEIVEEQCRPHLVGNYVPAIVCSMDCRVFFRQIIQDSLFIIPVLSHQEISSNMEIQVLGNINLNLQARNNPFADGVTS